MKLLNDNLWTLKQRFPRVEKHIITLLLSRTQTLRLPKVLQYSFDIFPSLIKSAKPDLTFSLFLVLLIAFCCNLFYNGLSFPWSEAAEKSPLFQAWQSRDWFLIPLTGKINLYPEGRAKRVISVPLIGHWIIFLADFIDYLSIYM